MKGPLMSANPHIFDARSIPDEVHSSTKDPEIAEWLKTGPVLGAHEPIHLQRRAHDAFIDEVMPPIGKIEHLRPAGPAWDYPGSGLSPLHTGACRRGRADLPSRWRLHRRLVGS